MVFRLSGQDKGGSDHTGQGMIAEVRAYWEALRDGDMLPRRDRVDPRGIAGALEHSFLIERIGPGLARFRIAGMAFNDLMGMDIRGMPLSSLFLGDARLTLQLALERVFHAPAVLTLDLTSERGLGRPPLTAQMIVLPMLNPAGSSDLAIGCIEIQGEIGRAPRRFAIPGTRHEAISAHADTPVPVPAPDPAQAFAETPTPYIPPSRTLPGVPYLRLVKG